MRARLIKIGSGPFRLRQPHGLRTGFAPAAMQVAVKARAVAIKKHKRQRDNTDRKRCQPTQ